MMVQLERIWLSVKYSYIKFVAWRYKMEYSWKYLTNSQKLASLSFFAGGVSVSCFIAYKIFQRQQKCLGNASNVDYSLDSLTRRRKKGIPPGLYNEGNTCFANSILQALSTFPDLLNWLETVKQQLLVENQLTVTMSLLKLVKVLSNKHGNEDVYSAVDVFNSLRAHGWVITNEQHDAYEFFQSLMSTVEEEISKIITMEVGEYYNTLAPRVFSRHIANRVSKKLPTVTNVKLTNPFKGSFANKLSCLSCGYQYPIKFETFNSLILNLQKVSPLGCTLESCFERFVESELLFDVICDNCGKNQTQPVKRTFSRQMSIAKLPACLCIELQRTFYDVDGRTLKNPMFVKFPEFLDVNRFTYRSQKSNRSMTEVRRKNKELEGNENTSTDGNYTHAKMNRPILLGGKSSPDSLVESHLLKRYPYSYQARI